MFQLGVEKGRSFQYLGQLSVIQKYQMRYDAKYDIKA